MARGGDVLSDRPKIPDARDYGGPLSQEWYDALEANDRRYPEAQYETKEQDESIFSPTRIYKRGLAGTLYDAAKVVGNNIYDNISTVGRAANDVVHTLPEDIYKLGNEVYHKGLINTLLGGTEDLAKRVTRNGVASVYNYLNKPPSIHKIDKHYGPESISFPEQEIPNRLRLHER